MEAKTCFFFIISIIPLVLGIALTVFGGVLYGIFGNICNIYMNISLPTLGLAPGIIMMSLLLIGFVGICFGARFFILIFVIIAFFASTVLYVFIGLTVKYQSKVELASHQCMNDSVFSYKKTDAAKAILDAVQNRFKCCGLNSSDDWAKQNLSIPSSCCRTNWSDPLCITAVDNIFTTGCLVTFTSTLMKYLPYFLAIFGVAAASFIILGILAVFHRRNQADVYERL